MAHYKFPDDDDDIISDLVALFGQSRIYKSEALVDKNVGPRGPGPYFLSLSLSAVQRCPSTTVLQKEI